MFLLDTNILSELPRSKPNARVVAWFESLPLFAVSSVTLEELSFGIAKTTGKKRTLLTNWFDALIAIPPQIIAVDEKIARISGELRASRERLGRKVAQADMLIAATALTGGFTLATRNTEDFEGCGVPLLNPFER